MPLPSKLKNETKKEFIQRCMKDSVMKEEYKDIKQRFAVCFFLLKDDKDGKERK